MSSKKLLERQDLSECRARFAMACKASRCWDYHVSVNKRKYGQVTGNHVSGVYNEAWPARLKDKLRKIAYEVTMHSDMAYAVRPKGVRMSTLRLLHQAVAERDGNGYYGIQTGRKHL